MTVDKFADRIKQLIDVTEQLLLYSTELKKLHDKYLPNEPIKAHQYSNSSIPSTLCLLHCSFFNAALLNLNTLLTELPKDKNKKEQSLFELADLITDIVAKEEFSKTTDELLNKLKANQFNIWRNKIAGHKDIYVAGDTSLLYSAFYSDFVLQLCKELLNDMNVLIVKYFDVDCTNSFKQLHNDGFLKMFTYFENELKLNPTKSLTYIS